MSKWRAHAATALREPLVHFLIAGGLLFLAMAGRAPDVGERRILVDEQVVAGIVNHYTRAFRRPPTAAELDDLIRDHVRGEVYYREALRLGLDVDDEVIKKRLRNKMLAIAGADAEARRPSDAELENLLAKDPARYAAPPRYSLEQLYLGDDTPAGRAAATASLRGLPPGARPTITAAALPLPARFDRASQTELAAQLGDDFAAALVALPVGTWSGPVASGFGLHLVRIEQRLAAPPPRLADVRQRLENDWRIAAVRKAQDAHLQALLDGYDVVIKRPNMIALLRLLLLLLLAVPAQADELRPGYLELTQQSTQQWKIVWKAPVLGGLAASAAPLLPGFCRVTMDQPNLSSGALVASGRADCSQSLDGAAVGLSGLEPGATDTLLRIAPLGRPVLTARLLPGQATAIVAAVPDGLQVARTYFGIGVEHIIGGFDHLLFVVAMVLLLQRGWPVVAAATAFTIAHSITLAGTTLGLFGLPQAPVEAVIALSIIFLAVEIVKARPGEARLSQRWPWLVAFLFGLLHGFGFAGALREIGLPEQDVAVALLSFNLGVEAGQLAIIAVAAAALAGLRRLSPGALRPAILASAYAIGSIAGFWFIERVWA